MKNFLQSFLLVFALLSTTFASFTLTLKNNQSPTIWVIKNHSTQDLIINHPHKLVGASAGWGTQLQAGRYAALYLDEPSFKLSCQDYHSNQTVNCHQVLEYLSVPRLSQNGSGTYWLAENTSFAAIIAFFNFLDAGSR